MLSKQKEKNTSKRGCPRSLNYELIKEKLLDNKKRIINASNGSIVPKSHNIWKEILTSFPAGERIPKQSDALYTFVVNNVNNVREDLKKAVGVGRSRSETSEANDSQISVEYTASVGGRPKNLDYSLIKEKILENKSRVMSCSNLSIISKKDKIWSEILQSFPKNDCVPQTTTALYSFVINNVDGIRGELQKALATKCDESEIETRTLTCNANSIDINSAEFLQSKSRSKVTDKQANNLQYPLKKVNNDLRSSLLQIFIVAIEEFPLLTTVLRDIFALEHQKGTMNEYLRKSWQFHNKENIPEKSSILHHKEEIQNVPKDDSNNVIIEIMKFEPSLSQELVCKNRCFKQKIVSEVISLPAAVQFESNFLRVMENHVFQPVEDECANCSAPQFVLRNVGDVVIFKLCWPDEIRISQKLESVAKVFRNPQSGYCMRLIGIIEVCQLQNSNSDSKKSDQYFAICYKRSNVWNKWTGNVKKCIEDNYEAAILFTVYAQI